MASAPSYWRNRDVVKLFFDGRRDTNSAPSAPQQSTQFGIEEALIELQQDKTPQIQDAFTAAALTVVRAAALTYNKDDEDKKPSTPSHDGRDLPPEIAEWQQLQDLRDECFEKGVAAAATSKRGAGGSSTSAKPSAKSSTTSASSTKKTNSTVASTTSGASTSATSTATASKEPKSATTATSFAVMESRAAVSRAVICAAASLAVKELTADFHNGDQDDAKLDPLDIPQNAQSSSSSSQQQNNPINMGTVILQAKTFQRRIVDLSVNAAERSTLRLGYQQKVEPPSNLINKLKNPFAWKKKKPDDDNDDDTPPELVDAIPYEPNQYSQTSAWKTTCLPRMQKVLTHQGTGHAVLCDIQWQHRHGRLAHLLQTMATTTTSSSYYGPHLIVTTTPNVAEYCREFQTMRTGILSYRSVEGHQSQQPLAAMHYSGTKSQRTKLRRDYFGSAGLGKLESAFHVVVTSYADFLEDYLDFCQMPFQIATIDEGFAWLGAAQADQNSQLAQLWEQGMFSKSDSHIGLATGRNWEFGRKQSPKAAKDAYIGITCRHRIILTPSLNLSQRQRSMTLPGLLNCILPHFSDVVKEEWDRSRILHDGTSLEHLKKLLTRSIVVHEPHQGSSPNLKALALHAMDGLIAALTVGDTPEPPHFVKDEDFVVNLKISQSRKAALAWFSPWMRYELGTSNFLPILANFKESNTHGHVCEEILPASVTSSLGVSGAITGSLAFRLGVRCCRSFGSEQGLRQHIAALHAPPGTWLCRNCASDCGTSQARTHHERSCGQPTQDPDSVLSSSKAKDSTVGPKGKVGKKAKEQKKATEVQEKDQDGSFRVPTWRGVWINPAGKHFVKIDKKRLTAEDSDEVLYFDTPDEAAQKHDKTLKFLGKEKDKGVQLNFLADGTRIIYEDNTAASAAGSGVEMLGGGSNSVVPALSVISIKDLPKDVKPLLRDPRQTSRTGGNSKRHVYAYRGVCRQARKGHDRWQSQISFGGTNHYLGTFDSEWDAAAIYAWAHLILYGEEATKKAQQEGEEAAAAYEKEKAAIAAGEVLPPPPKPEKKKKGPKGPKRKKTEEGADSGAPPPKKPRKPREKKDTPTTAKRGKPGPKAKSLSDSALGPLLTKGVAKVPIFGPRKELQGRTDEELMKMTAVRISKLRRNGYCTTEQIDAPPVIDAHLRPCAPIYPLMPKVPKGSALLLGLSATLFDWMVDSFVDMCSFQSPEHKYEAVAMLSEEYNQTGLNEGFKSAIQGSVCVIGRASKVTEQACINLGLGGPPLMGTTVGDLDCNIGGTHGSCSESAAVIRRAVTSVSVFQLVACNDADVVTINGRRITADMGNFPIKNLDVISVGARVFAFLLPA